jgi:CpeT/CpcT family (DUF1001)
MSLWPGDYDNREQVQVDIDMGRAATAPGTHLRVHSAVRHVELPQIDKHVLYVEDYKNDDPSQIFRHGLYVLSADNDGKSVRVKMLGFKDERKWAGAAHDTDKLKALTHDDVIPSEGCDIVLRHDGDTYAGGTDTKTCLTDKNRALDYQIRLMADQIEFRERSLNAKTSKPLSEHSNFAWHQMKRARYFSCMIDPPRSMVTPGRNGPGQKGYVVRIHDQGGTFTFTHADGRTLFMSLRNNWSYNMNRKTLVVTLQENNENGAGLGYAWTEPGADRLGMNPLWIHIQCDLDTPRNLEMQRSMRSVL